MKSVTKNETLNFCEKFSNPSRKKMKKKERFSESFVPKNEPYKKPKEKCSKHNFDLFSD
jgi:hypothetical protein